jgi:hypothetical protein
MHSPSGMTGRRFPKGSPATAVYYGHQPNEEDQKWYDQNLLAFPQGAKITDIVDLSDRKGVGSC